jgi:hypothetical protein
MSNGVEASYSAALGTRLRFTISSVERCHRAAEALLLLIPVPDYGWLHRALHALRLRRTMY